MFAKDGHFVSVQGFRVVYRFHVGTLPDRKPLQTKTDSEFLLYYVKTNLTEKHVNILKHYLMMRGDIEPNAEVCHPSEAEHGSK